MKHTSFFEHFDDNKINHLIKVHSPDPKIRAKEDFCNNKANAFTLLESEVLINNVYIGEKSVSTVMYGDTYTVEREHYSLDEKKSLARAIAEIYLVNVTENNERPIIY